MHRIFHIPVGSEFTPDILIPEDTLIWIEFMSVSSQ